jgi:hypothetical protein
LMQSWALELLPDHAPLLHRRSARTGERHSRAVPSCFSAGHPCGMPSYVVTSCSLAAGVFFLFNSTMHRSTHHSTHASKHDLAPC